MTEIWGDFLTHDGRVAHKWTHYFPIYERHFARYQNRPCVLWEIGVGEGGSLQLWKRFLGPYAQVVGLDIVDKSECQEEQIAVRQGDQCDPVFLASVLEEFGPPDVVIDDGSHVMDHISATFRFLYPRLSPVGVYLVEDLHTAYWPEFGGGLGVPGSFVELTKGMIDELNAEHSRGSLQPTAFTATTLSIHVYDSVVVFERGRHLRKHAPQMGSVTTNPPEPQADLGATP